MWILTILSLLSVSLSSVSSEDTVITPQIVGGTTASPGEFPYIVSLRNTNNAHFCGGTIISSRWILSAAHCTIGLNPPTVRAHMGTNSRTAVGTMYPIQQIVNHYAYIAITEKNDISLLQTTIEIVFTATVTPIALGSDFVGGGVSCIVAGWGLTSHPGSPAANLMKLNTQTITNANCLLRLPTFLITPLEICTFVATSKGNCMGDSGGPLVSDSSVIGVVSRGVACAKGYPDVYARVSAYRGWITDRTGPL